MKRCYQVHGEISLLHALKTATWGDYLELCHDIDLKENPAVPSGLHILENGHRLTVGGKLASGYLENRT